MGYESEILLGFSYLSEILMDKDHMTDILEKVEASFVILNLSFLD